jgi:hypothetical protein
MGFACPATVSPPRSGQTLISVCVVVSSGSRAPAALWRTVGVESGGPRWPESCGFSPTEGRPRDSGIDTSIDDRL